MDVLYKFSLADANFALSALAKSQRLRSNTIMLDVPGPAPAHSRASAWRETALRLWAERGLDPSNLFYEQLSFDAQPDDSRRRMRVQVRQLYVFARAAQRGSAQAESVIERAFPAFERSCAHENGGFIHLLHEDGSPADRLRDTYDHAFVLFALAALTRTAHRDHALALATETLAWLDTELAHDLGGFHEGAPATLPRRSNPHMHLLEAMIAWYRLDGDQRFLDRANAIAGLFERHFFDPVHGTLGEFFADDWGRVPPPQGDSVEPGHHFEWCWLLVRLAELGGTDLREQARALYRFGLAHGRDARGFGLDEIDTAGRIRRATRRLWPQTELIKAQIAMGDVADAAASFTAMADTYLATEIPGLWVDQFDIEGRVLSKVVPASTFYHIDIAIDELIASKA